MAAYYTILWANLTVRKIRYTKNTCINFANDQSFSIKAQIQNKNASLDKNDFLFWCLIFVSTA